MLIYLYLAFIGLSAHAADDPFKDAVVAYTKMRLAEETLRIEDLAPNTEKDLKGSLQADLTQKRIEFNTMVSTEKKEYSDWQKKVFDKKKLQTLNPQIVEYLSANFPDAKKFSPFEWKTIQELFGNRNQEAFFKIVQKVEEVGSGVLKEEQKTHLIVVLDPFSRILAGIAPQPEDENPIVAELKKNGHQVEVIQLSAYPKFDDQADELYRILTDRKGEPATIVSSKEASASVLRCIDLHPDILKSKKITGWINLNGKLYGMPAADSKARSLASVKKQTPMQKIENEARLEMNLLFRESLTVAAPLGKGFPIINVIQADNKNQVGNLGEAVVQGSKIYWQVGTPSVSSVLPLVRGPASTAGMKDAPATLY